MPIFATGTAAAVVEMYQAVGFSAPSYQGLQYDLSFVGANGQNLIAWANSLTEQYSTNYDPTNASLAQLVLDNLLGKDPANTPALQSLLTSVFAADPANRGAVIYRLAEALAHMEGDPVFGAAAAAWNAHVGEGYNIAMDSEQYTPKEGPGLPQLHGVQTLPLTTGADTLTGSIYGETFLAHPGTLGPGDVLNGNGGDDWLMYRWVPQTSNPGPVNLEGFHTTGIATLLVNRRDGAPGAGDTAKVDIGGMVGLAHVVNYASGSDVELLNVSSVVDLTLNQVFSGSTIVHYTAAALAASTGNMSIALNYNGTFFPSPAGPIGYIQADGISTFDVQAGNSDVGEIKSSTLLHMNITGAGDLRLHTLNFQGNLPASPNTLDAHAMTGRLDVALGTANAGTAATLVQGGSNVDTLRFTGKLGDYTIHLGDTITLHDNRAGSARDYNVAGVERLVFADQAVALDMGAKQEDGLAAMLAAAAFGPAALKDTVLMGKVFGLTEPYGNYPGGLSSFGGLTGLANAMLNSDAFYTATGTFLDNAGFVKWVYTNVYGHAPDAATQAALQAPLDNHSAYQGQWLAAVVLAAPTPLQAVLTGYAQGGLAYADQTYPVAF